MLKKQSNHPENCAINRPSAANNPVNNIFIIPLQSGIVDIIIQIKIMTNNVSKQLVKGNYVSLYVGIRLRVGLGKSITR